METVLHSEKCLELATPDLDVITDNVSRLFGHHVILACGQAKQARRVFARPLSNFLVGSIDYSSNMSCLCDQPRPHLCFTLPRACHGQMGAERFTPNDVLAFAPEWCGKLELAPPGKLVNTCIPTQDVLFALQGLLGCEADSMPELDIRLDAGTEAIQRAVQVIEILHEAPVGTPLLQRAREHWALMELLALWPHNYSRYLGEQQYGTRAVRRAIEYIESHLDEPLSMLDLARSACVGARALSAAFKRELGETPGQYLRRRRLESARAQLVACSDCTVTEVALRWQFNNPGMFAHYFHQQFGCLPSKLRRRQ